MSLHATFNAHHPGLIIHKELSQVLGASGTIKCIMGLTRTDTL